MVSELAAVGGRGGGVDGGEAELGCSIPGPQPSSAKPSLVTLGSASGRPPALGPWGQEGAGGGGERRSPELPPQAVVEPRELVLRSLGGRPGWRAPTLAAADTRKSKAFFYQSDKSYMTKYFKNTIYNSFRKHKMLRHDSIKVRELFPSNWKTSQTGDSRPECMGKCGAFTGRLRSLSLSRLTTAPAICIKSLACLCVEAEMLILECKWR